MKIVMENNDIIWGDLTCEWSERVVRKAVVWLCGVVGKPILKLTRKDYVEHGLEGLLEARGAYDAINIKVFNDLQHTISGWPGLAV